MRIESPYIKGDVEFITKIFNECKNKLGEDIDVIEINPHFEKEKKR